MDETEVQGGLTDEEKRQNVIRLAFGGDAEQFDGSAAPIEEVVPPGTTVILRGSAVTGRRWKDEAPFDADGPGTSDLDLTLVGDGALAVLQGHRLLRARHPLAPIERRRPRHRA